ncbi:MAG: MBL fold metallo-hydrolase [Bacteroidales bacterium]|nr:MBL fold metallo-hydrolase [Bacteroidales bacterium]MCF8389278.1 MBL fold metallo-hydrolase [Bacteroidales bacterium]
MIHIKTFVFNAFSVNTYLIYNEQKECIIIDAACNSADEISKLEKCIESNDLTLIALANTHGHMDHLAGIKYFKEKYNIPFYLAKEDEFLVGSAVSHAALFGLKIEQPPYPDKYLREGECFCLGEDRIEMLLVPGHSPGSIVFHFPEQSMLITGDVLFAGSIGRTDLPGGNYNTLIEGIKSKLLVLNGEAVFYPGHGPSSTIGEEKMHNPFLQ